MLPLAFYGLVVHAPTSAGLSETQGCGPEVASKQEFHCEHNF